MILEEIIRPTKIRRKLPIGPILKCKVHLAFLLNSAHALVLTLGPLGRVRY